MASNPSADPPPLFFPGYVEKIIVPLRICDPGDRYGRCLSLCGYDGLHHSLPEIGAPRHLCPAAKNGSSELESLSGFAGHRFCCGREGIGEVESGVRSSKFGVRGSPGDAGGIKLNGAHHYMTPNLNPL